MNQRREAKQENPFLGLQATVFQRKKPLPPIKQTAITEKPSRIPVLVSKTTKKYEKLPEITKRNKYEKQHEQTEQNKCEKLLKASEQNEYEILSEKQSQNKHGSLQEVKSQNKYQNPQEKTTQNINTDFSQRTYDDVIHTDAMATKKNIQTNAKTLNSTIDCFESNGTEFIGNALERRDRRTKRQKVFDGENINHESMDNDQQHQHHRITSPGSSESEHNKQQNRDILNTKKVEQYEHLDIGKNSDFRPESESRLNRWYSKSHPNPHHHSDQIHHQHHLDDHHHLDQSHHHHLDQSHHHHLRDDHHHLDQSHHHHLDQSYHHHLDQSHHHHLRYQWTQPKVLQDQRSSRRVDNWSRESVIFEHSLLSKRTYTTHCEEHTGIPCKPRLHKLHIS